MIANYAFRFGLLLPHAIILYILVHCNTLFNMTPNWGKTNGRTTFLTTRNKSANETLLAGVRWKKKINLYMFKKEWRRPSRRDRGKIYINVNGEKRRDESRKETYANVEEGTQQRKKEKFSLFE